MCLICVDYEKQKLTFDEAFTNLREVFNESDEHHLELWLRLVEDELKKESMYGSRVEAK